MLYKYQQVAVGKLICNFFYGLFLDMGLGKTRIVLEAINYLRKNGLKEKFLIIAPKRVVTYVWEQEAKKWGLNFSFIKLIGTPKQRIKNIKGNADIYLISTDLVVWLYESGLYKNFKHIVVDELSMFRNTSSNRFKALKKIRKEAKLLWGLTGTPSPNGLENIWGLIYLLDQGQRLGKYKVNFQSEFLEMDGFISQYKVKWKVCPGQEQRIYEKIKDICVSMKSEDYLELPDFQTNYIYTEMDSKTLKEYRKFVRDKLKQYEKGLLIAKNAAVLVAKCQQFSNGHTYLESGNVHNQHSIKLDVLKDFLECCDNNVLLFYNYITDRDYILNNISFAAMLDVTKWNKGKQRLALIHPKSGGHGLNLQMGGNIIVWFSPIWDLELYQQSIKRLHRPGQMCKVFNYVICMKNAIDIKIIKALEKKRISQDELLEMVKAECLSGTNV